MAPKRINHFFYAGDTAQTIAKGLSFRFTEAQSLFYEAGRTSRETAARAAAGAVWKEQGDVPVVAMPLLEKLTVNYRSHSGILQVANTVSPDITRI